LRKTGKPARRGRAAAWLFIGLACGLCSSMSPAQQDSEDPLIQMVVDLLVDADRDMRALGFQQVREEVPGEAATKRFVALLPKLPPDGQAGLLEALGDRGDAAARPAALEMLNAPPEAVRAAALKALGALGTAADVPVLANKAATGSKLEKGAARLSLVRLRGEQVNQAIVSTMAEGEPNTRAELLGVLAARGAKETIPTVTACAEDPEASVRLAALGALRFLADESHVATLVKILKAAKDPQERRKAELALLAVCSRSGWPAADAILAGLADADVPAQVALLHALARAGGPKALAEVIARLKDNDQAVRDEAVRMLSIWPDPAVADHLRALAQKGESLRWRVLAIRGLVRLASPQAEKPADLKTLAEVMRLAERRQEKRLVLGVLGGIATPESLAVVTPALDQPTLAQEAGLAAVMIAEKMDSGNKAEVRAAMQKVLQSAKSGQIRQRAQKVLDSL
jgi:HEAT repeat protein